MATINVSDEMYAGLSRRATRDRTTVDELVTPALAVLAAAPPTRAERDRAFVAWMARVDGRAGRYPVGFAADGGRDAIYDGCGE